MVILENLEKALLSEVASIIGRKSLTPDEDLLEQGIVDSLGLMKLIVYMEETFRIKISDEDIIPENFKSLNSMANLIEKRIADKVGS